MKASACNSVNNMIHTALKSDSLNERYSFVNQILSLIKNWTNIPKKGQGFCSPVELVESLYNSEDRQLPLYGFNGDVSTLHRETQVLIKLGFADIIDGCYLRLNPELGVNLDRCKLKAQYIKSKREFYTMKQALKEVY